MTFDINKRLQYGNVYRPLSEYAVDDTPIEESTAKVFYEGADDTRREGRKEFFQKSVKTPDGNYHPYRSLGYKQIMCPNCESRQWMDPDDYICVVCREQ